MNLDELKKILNNFSDGEIIITKHAHQRIQDKRRRINYGQIISLIKTQKGLYKFEEQSAKKTREFKFKLWFKLNYLYDMNVYIVIQIRLKKTHPREEQSLNRLEIISAHKVKRKIQEKIQENANKN
jgi:hypothetical protein